MSENFLTDKEDVFPRYPSTAVYQTLKWHVKLFDVRRNGMFTFHLKRSQFPFLRWLIDIIESVTIRVVHSRHNFNR